MREFTSSAVLPPSRWTNTHASLRLNDASRPVKTTTWFANDAAGITLLCDGDNNVTEESPPWRVENVTRQLGKADDALGLDNESPHHFAYTVIRNERLTGTIAMSSSIRP